MSIPTYNYDFPQQKIPNSKKNKAWAANCCDWIIAQGISCRQDNEVEVRYGILNGIVPEEFYKKILNPYNAKQDKYKKFPATMRNYDMMKGVIRRYVSEYLKNPHYFIVGANNPDVILAKNTKLRMELANLVQKEIAAQIKQLYTQWVND